MGYLKSTGTVLIYIGFFLALLAYLPGIPPDAKFSEFSIPPLQPGLTNNPKYLKRLDDAEILFKGELKGPESFASYNGELYTGLHGGDVVKIVGKHIVPVVKFGKPCEGFWMEKECGRPLGLYFDNNGVLYVSDTYNGIFKVDVSSGKYEKIFDISKPIEGAIPKLINSLDIASNGDIYWTDSSSEFVLQDGVYACLANPAGRLIKYDAATKKNTVLLSNLAFANGVKLSKDESFVIVVETVTSRLMKFNLKGSKAGRAEIFVEGLPGLPDNIHTDGEDGFLVSMVVLADAEHPVILHSLAPHPYIRKILVRMLYLLEAPFKLIDDVYPSYYTKRAIHWIGHFESIHPLQSDNGGILRINSAGKIIDAALSTDEKISGISSGFIFKDHIYLGSPYNEYLARVPLSKAFPSIKTKSERVIEKREAKEPTKPAAKVKPTTTPPPPTTTTTPPPTTTTTTPPPSTTTTPPPPTTTTTTPPPTTTTRPPPPTTTTTTPPPTTTTTPPPPTTTTTQKPKPVTTTPKPPQATTQPPPEPTKPAKVASPEPVRQVPASPPPPPSSTKTPVKEAAATQQQPPSKAASNEQAAKNIRKTEDAPKKSEQNVNNAPQSNPPKPSKPVPVSGQNLKDAETKKSEPTVKPPVATPPRN